VGPRARLDAMKNRKISSPSRGSYSNCSVHSPQLYRLSYLELKLNNILLTCNSVPAGTNHNWCRNQYVCRLNLLPRHFSAGPVNAEVLPCPSHFKKPAGTPTHTYWVWGGGSIALCGTSNTNVSHSGSLEFESWAADRH
jgi:hypothetical protein